MDSKTNNKGNVKGNVAVENLYDWEWVKVNTYYPHWAARARRAGMRFDDFREFYQKAIVDAYMTYKPALASFKTYSYSIVWKAFLYYQRTTYRNFVKDSIQDAEKYGKCKYYVHPQEWLLDDYVEKYLVTMTKFIDTLIDAHPAVNRGFLDNWKRILTWRCVDGMSLCEIATMLRKEKKVSKQTVYAMTAKIKEYVYDYIHTHYGVLRRFEEDALLTVHYALEFNDQRQNRCSITN